jgi:hypothetical protein
MTVEVQGRGERCRPLAERRLLDILLAAGGQPVAPQALREAGIEDAAGAIFELEQAGYRIGRAYAEVATGQRSFLGYRVAA